MNFDAFVNDIETNKWEVFGTEVYKDGVLAYSWGDTTENLHDIYSATKAVLSIAVGIVYDRGLIDLKKSILDYLPKEKVESLSQNQIDTFKPITIHRLLTMSVDGFPFRPEGDSWLDFALSCEIKTPERRVFHYNNICPFLVGVALTEVLGSDLGVFIEEEILKPLDITNYEYERSPEGYFYGASKMKLTVHDMSKFGLLLYNKGVYNDKRIVSEEYVEMATAIQQMNREGGYGFYIWMYRDGFSINGKWKQKVYIFPKRGIMVSYLSHIENDSHDLRNSMDKNILSEDYPAFPDYNNCLVNLANSVLNRFGASTSANTLPLADKYLQKKHKNTVVLLLDAMGTYIMDKHLDDDGFFKSHLAGSYHSVYPPTTVAATTSMLSGMYPNEHGWLGWDMYIPKLDKNVTLFTNTEQAREKRDAAPIRIEEDGTKIWDEDSYEEFVQAADYKVGFTLLPYENIVDKINNAGVKAYFSMPFMPPFPQDPTAIFERIEDLCKEPGEKFIYAYWNEPDSTMHKTGTMSMSTHAVITDLEEKVEKLASKLEDTLLLITADHGHMDSRNICILDYPEVMDCFRRLPTIEPRTINLFVKEEYMDSFPEIFKRNFGEENFLLMTREEVMERKVFGTAEDREGLAEMIGDFVAFSISDVSVFVSHYEAQVMPGGHAGLTPEEYIIPLIVVDKMEQNDK